MKVNPIKEKKHIELIKKLLKNNTRDYTLFVCGINNGLRGGDLLNLKVSQVKNKKIGDCIEIKEEKTGKTNYFYLNKSCYQSIQELIRENDYRDNDYLFQSRKGKNKLTTYSLSRLVKKWTQEIGLDGNYGSHTLRKTFGYIQRIHYGVSWELLSKRYNHSSPSITRVYLGIGEEEVSKIMMNEI